MFQRFSALRNWTALYYGPVPLLAALVLAFALVQHYWPVLATGQKYTDLVVGNITWTDQDKVRDFRALALFLGGAAVAAVGIGALFRWVGRDGPDGDVGRGLSALLLFALLPAIWWFARAASMPDVHPLYRPFVALVVLAVAVVVGLCRYRAQLTGARVLEVGGALLLLVILSWFAGLGLATLVGRVFATKLVRLERFGVWFAAVPPVAACATAILAILFSRRIEVLRKRLLRALFVVQIPLPFLYGVLIPAPFRMGTHLQRFPTKWTLPLALAGLVTVCWVMLARRYRAWRAAQTPEATNLTAVLSSLVLAAIPVFVLLPAGYLPEFFGDAFSYGEQFLPWQQLTEWHKLPYADFVPIHGLMPLLRLGCDALFFDGTAASYIAGDHVLLALCAVVTFLAARPLIGPVAALFLALCVPPLDRFFFLAPALLLLANGALLARPWKWLAVWCVLVPLEVMYNGAVGPAFVLGTAPAALWMAWRLLREDRVAFVRLAALLGVALLAVAAWHPTRAIIHGFVSFVSENAATNDVANGITWDKSFELKTHTGAAGVYFLWEMVRFAWVFIVALAAALFVKELAKPRGERNAQVLWLSFLVVPTLLAVSPWTLGRIDVDWASRVGCLSYVAVALLMPALLLVGRPISSRPFLPVFLVVAMALSDQGGGPSMAFQGHVSAKPFACTVVPPGAEFTDGATLGLPNVGRLVLSPNDRAELTELKQILDDWLRPGETFLDLTNRSAFYYYFNLPVPSLYSAHYVACNSHMQERMLRQLDANPPPVVMLAPLQMGDGGPASLRAYHLYRHYALHYVPVRRGRFTFLVDPARVPEAAKQDRAAQIRLLNEVFRAPELQSIPAAWGRSWSTLANRFDIVARLQPVQAPAETTTAANAAGNNSVMSYPLAGLELSGRSGDYLKIDLSCDPIAGQPPPVMQVTWESANPGMADSTVLTATGPCLLVPLGSYPTWLLSERLTTLQLRLANPGSCMHFAVREVQLLRLKSGD